MDYIKALVNSLFRDQKCFKRVPNDVYKFQGKKLQKRAWIFTSDRMRNYYTVILANFSLFQIRNLHEKHAGDLESILEHVALLVITEVILSSYFHDSLPGKSSSIAISV